MFVYSIVIMYHNLSCVQDFSESSGPAQGGCFFCNSPYSRLYWKFRSVGNGKVEKGIGDHFFCAYPNLILLYKGFFTCCLIARSLPFLH